MHGATVNETRFRLPQRRRYGPIPRSWNPGFSPSPAAVRLWGTVLTHITASNCTTIPLLFMVLIPAVRVARGDRSKKCCPSEFQRNLHLQWRIGAGPECQPATRAGRLQSTLLERIESIERFRRTVVFQAAGPHPGAIAALGGGLQFSINAGVPGLRVHRFDIAVFAGMTGVCA